MMVRYVSTIFVCTPSTGIWRACSPELGLLSSQDTADNTAGQDLLLSFMDPTSTLSVGQALYDEPSLNGYANDLDIVAQTGYVLFPDPGGEGALLGCQWTVRVLPANS